MASEHDADGSAAYPFSVDPSSRQEITLPDMWNDGESIYSTPPDSLTVFQIMLLRSLESIAQQLDRIRQSLDDNAKG